MLYPYLRLPFKNSFNFLSTMLVISGDIILNEKINNPMAKYGKKSQESVKEAMDKMKKGKLKTGTGKKVKNKKQAIAIGLSEAREKGAKVPPSPKSSKGQRGPANRKKTSGTKKRSAAKSKK